MNLKNKGGINTILNIILKIELNMKISLLSAYKKLTGCEAIAYSLNILYQLKKSKLESMELYDKVPKGASKY
jgi:hypothetical protein